MAFARFNQCSPCCASCQLVVGTINCGSSFEVDINVRAGPTAASKIVAATSVVANYQSTILQFDSAYRNPAGNLVTLDTRGQFAPSTQSSIVFLNDVPCTGVKLFNLQTGNCCGPCRQPSNPIISWNDPNIAEFLGEGTSYTYIVSTWVNTGFSNSSFISKVGPFWDDSIRLPCEDGTVPCVITHPAYGKSIIENVTSSIDIPVNTPFFLYTATGELGMYGCCFSPCLGPPCSYPDFSPHEPPRTVHWYGLFRLSCIGTSFVDFRVRAVVDGSPPPTAADFAVSLPFYSLFVDSYSCNPLLLSSSITYSGQTFIEGPFFSGTATGTVI